MAKKIKGGDKINDTTLHELLLMMDAKLNHLEDISADNRAIIVKLVKQSNQIVNYLKQLEIDIVDEYESGIIPELSEEEQQRIKKAKELKEVLNDFMDKRKDLKEFEKELKKNKDMLTPGQVGES